jgi:superfamily II DNA/RNA helicase
MNNFENLKLSQQMLEALKAMNFAEPTPIQAQTIPVACSGKDVMGSAQTGTGKTAAFGIPLVEKLISSPKMNALILTPTRELATQVMKTLKGLLGRSLSDKTALLIGGEAIFKQFKQLNKSTRLVVATPGRLMDHVRRKTVLLDQTGFIVLDETDRMLDMGFMIQIDEIMGHLPKERQTLLFSATIPPNIAKISQKYLKDPIRIAVGDSFAPALKIKQEVIEVSESEKYKRLLVELENRTGSVIIFVNMKANADKLASKLKNDDEYLAEAIHGDLKHQKRERVIKSFHQKRYRILVATDIAARGLDIPHIEHVINYDLPQCPEDYIHRIGRTARAGSSGEAISFVSPRDRSKWSLINKMMNKDSSASSEAPRSSGATKARRSGKPFNSTRSGGTATASYTDKKRKPFKGGQMAFRSSAIKPKKSIRTISA